MRTVIWFIYFWLYLIVLWPSMHRAIRLDKAGDRAGRDAIVQKVIPRWAGTLLRLAGARVQVAGRENIPRGPVVFVANHQGYFDIPLLLAHLDAAHPLLAKQETLKIPLIRTWMRLLGCQFVDRDNPRQSVSCLNEAARMITQEGRSFIIFPEGTRSRGDAVGDFKSGGFKVASKAGVPVVPVVIDGSYRLMEGNGMWIRPAAVRVTILPPVETKDLDRAALKHLGDEVRGRIVQAKGTPAQ